MGTEESRKQPLATWSVNRKYFIRGELERESESHSVVSDSLQPHGLYGPWNSPGQNTGVGSLSLLQGIFPTQALNPCLPHCRQIPYQLSRSWALKAMGVGPGDRGGRASRREQAAGGAFCVTPVPPGSACPSPSIPQFPVSFPWCPLRSTQERWA